ncbi:MAG: 5-formyltetrahydrofolate cyclo-ligase [Peptococcaceae bacterium]|jgi:5-formyltetrahydrofolate cyclo-ligase|nr:5-formyltetrahydrofolate cyclo-ligase [Peptococcaceae bacterium]
MKKGASKRLKKESFRQEALRRRKALSPLERRQKSALIFKELQSLRVFEPCQTIMTYLNFRDEVETTPIAEKILQDGKDLIIPFCQRREIVPCAITDLVKDVQVSNFGIREPLPDRLKPVSPEEIDLVLVPGLAFDYHGHRIGFGAGYYDRFLPRLRQDAVIIGIAFACQLFDNLPREDYDYKLPLLVTENGLINAR